MQGLNLDIEQCSEPNWTLLTFRPNHKCYFSIEGSEFQAFEKPNYDLWE